MLFYFEYDKRTGVTVVTLGTVRLYKLRVIQVNRLKQV